MGQLAETIRKIQQSITEHRAEIERLENELVEAGVALAETTPSAARRPARRTRRAPAPARKRPIRPDSNVGHARTILQHEGRPVHIDSLLKYVERMSGKTVPKTTLVSSLSRYVKAGDTFTRPATSMYGLKEWESGKPEQEDFLKAV